MSKSLSKEVTTLISNVFNQEYGYKPKNIRSFGNEKPSDKNRYLFNQLMTQYEGLLDGKSGMSYVFFIFKDSQGKSWEYSFTPFRKEDSPSPV